MDSHLTSVTTELPPTSAIAIKGILPEHSSTVIIPAEPISSQGGVLPTQPNVTDETKSSDPMNDGKLVGADTPKKTQEQAAPGPFSSIFQGIEGTVDREASINGVPPYSISFPLTSCCRTGCKFIERHLETFRTSKVRSNEHQSYYYVIFGLIQ
jgi:hypothetical protein